MDAKAPSVSPNDLYARLGTANAPLLIDVRRPQAFDADQVRIIGAARRLPDEVAKWRGALPASRPIVAYCVHGHAVGGRTRQQSSCPVRNPACRHQTGSIGDTMMTELSICSIKSRAMMTAAPFLSGSFDCSS